jgi:hypothetical protein
LLVFGAGGEVARGGTLPAHTKLYFFASKMFTVKEAINVFPAGGIF